MGGPCAGHHAGEDAAGLRGRGSGAGPGAAVEEGLARGRCDEEEVAEVAWLDGFGEGG